MRIGAEEGIRGRNPIRIPSRRVTGETHTNETDLGLHSCSCDLSSSFKEEKMCCLLPEITPKALKPHKDFVLSKTLRMEMRIKIPLKKILAIIVIKLLSTCIRF